MLSILRRLLGDRPSGNIARQRMQFVLMHDRVDITPDIMEAVKNDIIKVLSRYMEIDNRSIKVDLEQGKDFMALISNVQIKRVYRHASSI
jgi:cell division topological specificity factor